ncbi:HNH endonuclease [Aliarcobacter butzleri]|uniref:HNH endonuclease n=1 Tax=Aliarcobacter butzleri TaxID=28197 RepID=UPI001EDB646D|nr:HNH endonuclease signature motif containing protein [Aliarcobacter butzleri]MCG3701526.1 HNH endonuclease [Aliarcobacter butzleri]
MYDFRNFTPTRRNITKSVSTHSAHKNDLKIDFKDRCGYCNTIDTWRTAWYEVDHFVPQKYLSNILNTEYSNLVYSCRSCNNAKRANWPTKSETIYNDGEKGFIDPCLEEYGTLFFRNDDGSINIRVSQNFNIANWIYTTLKFHKPIHAINWNIEKTSDEIDKIKKLIQDKGGIEKVLTENRDIVVRIYNLFDKYYEYTKLLTA